MAKKKNQGKTSSQKRKAAREARKAAREARKAAREARKAQNNGRHNRQRLEAKKASIDPQPAPTARGFFCEQIWHNLELDNALSEVGIDKDGLAMSSIFMLVIMMGIMNAASLNALSEKVGDDQTLKDIFKLEKLDEKILYRALESVEIEQYMAFQAYLLAALQTDTRTASRSGGIIGGDTTQIAKPYAHKIPGVHVLFLHSEKRFVRGVEVISTHYADSDKDYPLFMSTYEPNLEVQAERKEAQARKKAEVDGRSPQQVLDYLVTQVSQGNQPELVILSGNRLNRTFRNGVQSLNLPWLGVSSQQRQYTLNGRTESQKAKNILKKIFDNQWIEDADSGYRLADLGPATSTIGSVRLIAAEHMADQVRTLYLVSEETAPAVAMTSILNLLMREKAKLTSGILHQMLDLRNRSRSAGIIAENATFDSWFFVPWFINQVLSLGFKRVITKPRANFNYIYQGQSYKLDDLWQFISPDDFKLHEYNGKTYYLASLLVEVAGLGQIKLTFVKQKTRR